ncbi:hypothetical protein E2R68_03620 [Psychromonas sp. RZ22]|uniref:cysteine-rich CWC family protein n=1 Tax=Psychromonas algarum TaxID=2555643 RepID=UPI0010676100|nr:cysteine-rich CWC family protein [Psychromonas sp. RZ22]TEW56192.1 hypothetical protein E2R68_03620 [Psychromonas sp. RZ22]
MSQNINTSVCPFCQKDNQCAVESDIGCWCSKIKVPVELTALVPIKLKKKACICSACVAHFNLDPEKFLNQISMSAAQQ